MHRFVPYIFKTLLRHRTRTIVTISGAAVAFFVLYFVGAISAGLVRLGSDQQADRQLIVFQANRFCPFTSSLPEDYARTISRLPGVQDVVPIKVYTNNCRASLDVIVFHGIPAEKLKTARQLELLEGDWAGFEQVRDAAIVGRGVARRRGLSVGQKFSIGGVTVVIAGIYRAEIGAEEDYIYTHLEFLQRMRGKNEVGRVTQFEVHLAPQADAQSVMQQIDAAFRGGPVATDTRTKGVFQANSVADLADLIGFARWLGYACIGLVLALVSTTTVMAVQDRIHEHAILRTIGLPGRLIFGLVLVESGLLSLVGATLGVLAAVVVLATRGISVGAEAVTISFSPSLELTAASLAIALATGILAGILPGWQAARTDIVPALRQM